MGKPRRIGAAAFKQQCLALLDDVEKTGRTLVVTKHGRPVARVVPVVEDASGELIGSVTLLSSRPEDYYSTGERWSVEDD